MKTLMFIAKVRCREFQPRWSPSPGFQVEGSALCTEIFVPGVGGCG